MTHGMCQTSYDLDCWEQWLKYLEQQQKVPQCPRCCTAFDNSDASSEGHGFRPAYPLNALNNIDVSLHNGNIRPNFENERVAGNAKALLRSIVSESLMAQYAIGHCYMNRQKWYALGSEVHRFDLGSTWVPVTYETTYGLDIPKYLRWKLHDVFFNHSPPISSCPVSRQRLQRLWMTFGLEDSQPPSREITKGPHLSDRTFSPFQIPALTSVLLELRTDRAYQNNPDTALYELDEDYELGYRIEWQRAWKVNPQLRKGYEEIDIGRRCGRDVLGHGFWGYPDLNRKKPGVLVHYWCQRPETARQQAELLGRAEGGESQLQRDAAHNPQIQTATDGFDALPLGPVYTGSDLDDLYE
ncbi:MAG: hypothetical protein Q9160_006893 [Pyrenula sp. 1 TL-2023]